MIVLTRPVMTISDRGDLLVQLNRWEMDSLLPMTPLDLSEIFLGEAANEEGRSDNIFFN